VINFVQTTTGDQTCLGWELSGLRGPQGVASAETRDI